MNPRKCFRAFMIRLSCVQNGLCPDYRAFKVAYVQTIVRSKLPMIRLSCVPSCICPDYRAFKIAYVQTIVRSKLHMSRLSCVQNCLCPDYRAFIFFPDRVILNARRHLVRSFRSGHIQIFRRLVFITIIAQSIEPKNSSARLCFLQDVDGVK